LALNWPTLLFLGRRYHYRDHMHPWSGWNASFFLILRDGAKFDIMTWPRSTLRVYPEIASALKGVDFAFDTQGVRRGCDLPYRDLLLVRP
jgi:hypothetical protein